MNPVVQRRAGFPIWTNWAPQSFLELKSLRKCLKLISTILIIYFLQLSLTVKSFVADIWEHFGYYSQCSTHHDRGCPPLIRFKSCLPNWYKIGQVYQSAIELDPRKRRMMGRLFMLRGMRWVWYLPSVLIEGQALDLGVSREQPLQEEWVCVLFQVSEWELISSKQPSQPI